MVYRPTVMILSFQTVCANIDIFLSRSRSDTDQGQHGFSLCLYLLDPLLYMVKPNCSNFMVTTTMCLGIRISLDFTVHIHS